MVNDGSQDDTAAVVDAIEDKRIKLIEGTGSGSAHARNLGLREVSGTLVTFLDDDNLMSPGWARAVVAAFQDRPDLNAVYGAQLRANEPSEHHAPLLLFVSPFDWERLVHANYIDLGVIAHRNGLGELWFDESLPRLIDYEYVVNLAGRFGIEPLPVVASYYMTDAPGRITSGPVDEQLVAELHRRFRVFDSQKSPPPCALETRGSDKAWMTESDADLLEEILVKLGRRFGDTLRVLEWGSGLSTLHYPYVLEEQGISVRWTAVEHNRQFFRWAFESKLREQGASIVWVEDPRDGTSLMLDGPGVMAVVFDKGEINPFDPNPTRYVDRGRNLDDYVALPATLGVRFHVVIVDGRKRRRCLTKAASLLDEGGVALLHDAQRPYYESAFSSFRSGRRIGDELWIGAQHETDFSDLVPEEALSKTGFDYVPGT